MQFKDVARILRSLARSLARTTIRVGDAKAVRERERTVRSLYRAANDVVELARLKNGTYPTVKLRGIDVPVSKKDLDLSRG